MPGLHDPFAGGGAIPLEAQRLGLETYASDLNPVAVLINKAMIEIPPKFAGRPPVHPDARKDKNLFTKEWKGAEGLAEDVRRYGHWLRDEAEKRIGHLYPKVEITPEIAKERLDLKPIVGQRLTVIAWIWARTVKSPNPAYSYVDVPLVSSFVLAKRAGKEAYVQPIIDGGTYHFQVRAGKPSAEAKTGTKTARGANFRCLVSNAPIEPDYIKSEAKSGRMGAKLIAMVAEGPKGRVYLSPTQAQEQVALAVQSEGLADNARVPIANDPRALWCILYGLSHFDRLFTSRQLTALGTLSDLINEARDQLLTHARNEESGRSEPASLAAESYADAICLYLGLILSKSADSNNSLCPWEPVAQCSRQLFGRQAIPMLWDYAEANPLHDSSGGFVTNLEVSVRAFSVFPAREGDIAHAFQANASEFDTAGSLKYFSTDPPYYDNIGYADLSDFFYVWLRRCLKATFPELLSTIAVPKTEELVATPYRHGGKEPAEHFFLLGMTDAMKRIANAAHPSGPVTIYYAFKQSDTESEGTNSTGWETFLEAVMAAGLLVVGTWPMRTEMTAALKNNTNSLASSVVLVCRRRNSQAGTISRRQFVRLLNEALPDALAKMTGAGDGDHSPVAPVDLSQAIIGPGMAIFSRYDAVLEADGKPMNVKTALQLINRFLAEDDFDGDTQFCLHWFEQHGWEAGRFGEADTLARAKGTSVDGVKQAGVIEAGGGNVRLLKWREYPADWNPSLDTRLPVWEALHQMVRAHTSKGDAGAGKVLKGCAAKAEAARQLAYRLYTLCERKGWAEDARAYNELVTGWSGIESAASSGGEQQELF